MGRFLLFCSGWISILVIPAKSEARSDYLNRFALGANYYALTYHP